MGAGGAERGIMNALNKIVDADTLAQIVSRRQGAGRKDRADQRRV